MSENFSDKSKPIKLGGKGSIRRKIRTIKPITSSTPNDVNNTLKEFKKNHFAISNVTSSSFEYETFADVMINPDVRVILHEKEPVCYFFTGKFKSVNLKNEEVKKEEDDFIDLDPVKAAAMRNIGKNE